MNCHEVIDVMEEALEGRLPAGLRAGFEEHVTACASCGTYLEQLRITHKALKNLRQPAGTSPQRKNLIEAFKKEFRRGPDRRS